MTNMTPEEVHDEVKDFKIEIHKEFGEFKAEMHKMFGDFKTDLIKKETFQSAFARPGYAHRPLYYKLDAANNAVPASLSEFGASFENPEKWRRVGRTEVGKYTVSTVFLCIDNGFGSEHHLLFETMIFTEEGKISYQARYATYADALAGHEATCKLVLAGFGESPSFWG